MPLYSQVVKVQRPDVAARLGQKAKCVSAQAVRLVSLELVRRGVYTKLRVGYRKIRVFRLT